MTPKKQQPKPVQQQQMIAVKVPQEAGYHLTWDEKGGVLKFDDVQDRGGYQRWRIVKIQEMQLSPDEVHLLLEHIESGLAAIEQRRMTDPAYLEKKL